MFEAVAFEDSPNGIMAATSAGIFCIAVPNGITASLALDEADLVLRADDLGRERCAGRAFQDWRKL